MCNTLRKELIGWFAPIANKTWTRSWQASFATVDAHSTAELNFIRLGLSNRLNL
jgi:hypothetical protein